MKRLILLGVLSVLITGTTFSQNTLFDDTRLSSIYITISADSLALIYDSVLSDHYYTARFIFDDNEKKDTLEDIGFRLRGNSSRYAQKKSFKISFSEYVSGRKYQGVKKINLNGEHNDPTMIREKLFYDVWRKAGMPERRTSFVKVFINQSFYGLYTNLEEMEKDWLTRVFQQDGGNLYKCSYPADLVYLGNDQQAYMDLENTTVTGGRVYELQTNKSQDDYTHLVELITVLDKQPDEQFAASITQIMNVDQFLKALAIDVATGNWDNYGYNRNNYYLYDNPSDLRFNFITYDPDNSFGVDFLGVDWGTRDCRYWINQGISLPLAQKLLAVPVFFNEYKQFLDTIARFVINPDSIFPRIDSIKNLIHQAAIEDTYRTLDYGYTNSDFNDGFIKAIDQHTPYGIKPFLTARKQSILNQLNPSGIGDNESSCQDLKLFPNPASEYITFSLPKIFSSPANVKIIDTFGRTLEEFEVIDKNERQVTLPVRSLASGLYLLRVESSGVAQQVKFIKE
jgi:hypothetical protein